MGKKTLQMITDLMRLGGWKMEDIKQVERIARCAYLEGINDEKRKHNEQDNNLQHIS